MDQYRAKSVLGKFAFALFLPLVFIIYKFSQHPSTLSAFHKDLTLNAISAFNICILFIWISYGMMIGVIAALASLIATLVPLFRIGSGGYFLFSAAVIYTSILGYYYRDLGKSIMSSAAVQLEKLEEEANLLQNDIKTRKDDIRILEDKLTRYSLLKNVVESLSVVFSMEDIKDIIIDRTPKTLGKSGRISFFTIDAQKQALSLAASAGEPKVMTKTGDYFDHWVLRHRKSLIIEDIDMDFRFPADEVRRACGTFKSLIASPLVSEERVTGILRLDNPSSFAYKPDDLRLLGIISDLGAVALQNANLYSRTQELAIKDDLTGLAVRRYFLERFKDELNRTARNRDTLSVLMIDIDNFKDYNDRYGHAAGDIVLRYLARLISSMVHEGDVIARYGGEEMSVLLCGRNKRRAGDEAELLRKAVSERPIFLRRHQADLTISIGVSSYPEDALTDEELIKIADERLYKAKAKGRNRVCLS